MAGEAGERLAVAEIFVGITLRHVRDALSGLRLEIAPEFQDEENSAYGSSYQLAVGELESAAALLADMQIRMRRELGR